MALTINYVLMALLTPLLLQTFTLHCHLDLEMTQGSQIQLLLLFQCLLSFLKKHRFIYLAMPGLSFGMWYQTPAPNSGVLGAQSLRHWTIREIPSSSDFFFSWWHYACMCAKSLQSCPTLWDPMDCSPLRSSGHGIIPAWCWSGLPFPPPGDLPNPEIKPTSSAAATLAGRFLSLAHFQWVLSLFPVGM